MKSLNERRWAVTIGVMLLTGVIIGWNFGPVLRNARGEDAIAKADDEQVAHGKYLVHHVAKCIECHTPRDSRGALIEPRLLTGATIPVLGPTALAPWATQSVWIAGLGSYEDGFVRHLLTHGERPDGSHPDSPMPSFALTAADANAVIAYLRTL